jgi:hypothetical protein
MRNPERWSMEIVEAIDRADAVLALLSPQANVRRQDQSAVEALLRERDLDELAPHVAALAPTIRAEDIPTWIDDFVIEWMLSSRWFRAEVCGAFRRAVAARSEAPSCTSCWSGSSA